LPLADFHDLLIDDSTNLTILPFSFDAMVALSTNTHVDELTAFRYCQVRACKDIKAMAHYSSLSGVRTLFNSASVFFEPS
jgi:hypothetical protein